MSQKTPVILLYGGRSTEHEVSCRSGAFVVRHCPGLYELWPVGVSREGVFYPQNIDTWQDPLPDVLPIHKTSQDHRALQWLTPGRDQPPEGERPVIFSMLHGSYGEDGSAQGLYEWCDLPYVGCDGATSALTMDKVWTKDVVKAAGVPVVPSVWFGAFEWQNRSDSLLRHIKDHLKAPYFVKPARLGSSVGMTKVPHFDELENAIHHAFEFDEKVLVETGYEVREIEFAILGGWPLQISQGGEAIAHADFYSYESKYAKDSRSEVKIPAALSSIQKEEAMDICRRVASALNLYGMARIDLFLTPEGRFYLNEVNTLPGFTSISQYPLLWQHEGLLPEQLLTKLLDSARDRFARKQGLKRSL